MIMDAKRKLEELYKKLHSLKDMREAIRMYKASVQESDMEKAEPTQAPVVPSAVADLKYIGRKKLSGAQMVHMVGSKDPSKPYYEISVNLHGHAQKIPSISVHSMHANGKLIDSSPRLHSDMKSAMKDVYSHAIGKGWISQ
jgi:hypothetical protein